MYTQAQVQAIPRGLTAFEKAQNIFKRVTGALNKLRREAKPTRFYQNYEIFIPGQVAHPTTAAYTLHLKLTLGGGVSLYSWLSYCACSNDDPTIHHNWLMNYDPFDTEWLHFFANLPFVLEKLATDFGPQVRQRIEQLEQASVLIGPYLNL